MEFKQGDRVYHNGLKKTGTFIEYDWSTEAECHVMFDVDEEDKKLGYEDCRHVTTSQLELVGEIR